MSSTNPFAAPADPSTLYDDDLFPRRSLLDLPWLLFSFEGRIPRRAYWGGTIGATLAFYLAMIPVAALSGGNDDALLMLLFVAYIPLLWTNLALQVKRWHDLGKSGAWVFVNFIPLVGGLITLVQCGCTRGEYGTNAHGPDLT